MRGEIIDWAGIMDKNGNPLPVTDENKKMLANMLHVRFTHSKTAFRWPPEPLIKKLKRILGIKPNRQPNPSLD